MTAGHADRRQRAKYSESSWRDGPALCAATKLWRAEVAAGVSRLREHPTTDLVKKQFPREGKYRRTQTVSQFVHGHAGPSSNGAAFTSSRFGGRFSCRRSGWLRHQGVYFRQTSGESPAVGTDALIFERSKRHPNDEPPRLSGCSRHGVGSTLLSPGRGLSKKVTIVQDEDIKLLRRIVAGGGRKYTAGNVDRSKYDRLVDLGWLTPFKTNISDVEYQVTEKGRAASVDNAHD